MLGQYRGPRPQIWPLYIGARCKFARMMSWTAAFVCVEWQAACGTVMTGSPLPLTQAVTKSGTERPAGEKKRMAWRDRTLLLS